MHKITTFTGQARHGWEKMTPSIGLGRPHPQDVNLNGPPPLQNKGRPASASSIAISPTGAAPGVQINLSFNVPFASALAGPDPDEIIYSSPGAVDRWVNHDASHDAASGDSVPIYELPVHKNNEQDLRSLCRSIGEMTSGAVQATVTSAKPKAVPGMIRGPLNALVTNVCISGESEAVQKMRAKILNETPITLVSWLNYLAIRLGTCLTLQRSSSIEVSSNMIMSPEGNAMRADVLKHMDDIANLTKADLFLLHPKQTDADANSLHGSLDATTGDKLRIVIYGVMEGNEHAKTRLLIMIDQIVCSSDLVR